MITAEDVLKIANSKVGEKETGNNTGPIVHWSCDPWLPKDYIIEKPHPKTGKMGWARWCAGFVSTCYLRAGYPMQKLGSTSVSSLYTRCAAAVPKDNVQPPGNYAPAPADIIFFKDTVGKLQHTGLVRYSDDASVYTIEGNKGNEVALRKYSKSDPTIYGYIKLL